MTTRDFQAEYQRLRDEKARGASPSSRIYGNGDPLATAKAVIESGIAKPALGPGRFNLHAHRALPLAGIPDALRKANQSRNAKR